MFLPLHDDVPMRHLRGPAATVGLIVLCTLVYAIQITAPFGLSDTVIAAGLGMIPAVLFGPAILPAGLPLVPEWLTPVTYNFLHASWLHLGGNMLFLWVFGDNVEDAMGHLRYVAFLLICGVAGALVHAFVNPGSEQPLIGASGAVSGVIAAYLILHPQVRVFGLMFNILPITIPAYVALGAWVAIQLANALIGMDGAVGWWAHLGGLAAGAAATPLLVRPRTRFFGGEDGGAPA